MGGKGSSSNALLMVSRAVDEPLVVSLLELMVEALLNAVDDLR